MHKPPFSGSKRANVYTKTGALYTTVQVSNESGSWSSSKTPGFKSMKPRNRPNNPFSATYYYETSRQGTVWNVVLNPLWVGATVELLPGTSFAIPTGSFSSAAKAKNRLLDQLKGQSVNLAQAFAERKQTADMLARSVNRLASAAMAIRRGNLRHASELFGMRHSGRRLKDEIKPSPSNLANHWLEYSYGWRPLLQDIYGSAEAIAKTYYEKRPTILKASSHEMQKWKDYPLKYSSTYQTQELLTASEEVKTNYVVAFVESNSFCQSMASTGLTNPAALAWELIPYSFVVDWIVPIGPYLNRLDATVGLSFSGGTTTTTKKFYGTSRCSFFKGNAGAGSSGLGRSFVRESKTRSVLTSFPSPTLEVEPHIGVSRALSGLSLLIQSFKR